MSSLSGLIHWLSQIQEVYPALFFLGGMGIPLFHSDILLFLLGLANSSPLILVLCTISLALGELVLSLMARRFGLKIYRHGPLSLFIRPKHLLRTRKLVRKYGTLIIFIVRFIPGARSTSFVLLGVLGYRPSKIFLSSLAGLAIWAPLLYSCGRLLWLPLDSLRSLLSSILPIFLSMIVIAIVYLTIKRRIKK